MKLASFYKKNLIPGVGLILPDGRLLDLNAVDPHYPRNMNGLLGGDGSFLDEVRRLFGKGSYPERALLSEGEFTLRPPVPNPGKFLLCGLNYRKHLEELGLEPPGKPALFSRFASTLLGAGQPILVPKSSDKVDWEGEFVAVIGRQGKYIPRAKAMEYVVGYTCFNDVSIRDYQQELPEVTISKNFDCSGPLGPWLVTADEIPEPKQLNLKTLVNGELMQEGRIGDLVFDLPELIELISSAMTLSPGDLISTGTPGGVGHARTPPLYLKHGDTVTVSIEGIGDLVNPVADEK